LVRVGVIQSNYIPWRGYFDFIRQVDLFVFHDDLQYTKNDWRNRNRIKTANGLRWLTVPVHYRRVEQRIDETTLDGSRDWAQDHLNQLEANYRKVSWYRRYQEPFAAILRRPHANISELNVELIRWLMGELGIRTPTVHSRELGLSGSKTARLIELLRKVRGTVYLSGPAARDYLELDRFREAGIGLEYKTYDYAAYPQAWGPFQGAVTVLDLLFNAGPDAPAHLASRTPNERVV
jgi:hypothetical protein